MAGRIVLFGATGYTGRLVAEALVARGAAPLLAGRNGAALDELARELGGGGLDTAVADVARPESVAELVNDPGDVLVSTVGPFARWGRPAVDAAVSAGCSYLDSTGESSFIRGVFEEHGPRAERSGAALVTAFGYDWVPGNLAGALALRDAGPDAVRVSFGYYAPGGTGRASGGTEASAAGVMLDPSFAFRSGQLETERGGKRVGSFQVEGRRQPALSVGGSEHFGLPQLYPRLRDVEVYLGWFGPMTRPMQALSLGISTAMRVPGARAGMGAAVGRLVRGSTGGPSAEQRAKSRSHVVAVALDASVEALAEARLDGVDGYTFTAGIMAWGAVSALDGGLRGKGALGPVSAFGLDELERGCAEAGLDRVA